MKVIYGLQHIRRPARGSCVTIGAFDGIHVGHRKVIKNVVSDAGRLSAASVVLTFDPHPSKVLDKKIKPASLVSLDHRIRLIEELGVDIACVLKFTKALARMSAEKFVKNILVKKLGAREICVGENFCFGRLAGAGVKILKRIAKDNGVRVRVVKPVLIGKEAVSSSRIRKAITAGDLREAERLLGRPVSVLGTVVSGARLGRELGYPTANVNPHHEVVPPSGVYAVRTNVNGKAYGGILNIGVRPTFYAPRDREPAVEAHLFDFSGSIYGKDIEILFIKRLRGEIRFENARDLVKQIKRDKETAKKIMFTYFAKCVNMTKKRGMLNGVSEGKETDDNQDL